VELVTVAEAARAVDRSVATVRRWVRAGKLTRHEGATPAHGGSAVVLVDLDQLRALVVTEGLVEAPGRRVAVGGEAEAGEDTPDAARGADGPMGAARDVRALAARLAAAEVIAGLRVEVATLRGEVAVEAARRVAAEDALTLARVDLTAARAEVVRLREELGARDAEARELRALTTPRGGWWRRLIGG
jgi:hypothetical protein